MAFFCFNEFFKPQELFVNLWVITFLEETVVDLDTVFQFFISNFLADVHISLACLHISYARLLIRLARLHISLISVT